MLMPDQIHGGGLVNVCVNCVIDLAPRTVLDSIIARPRKGQPSRDETHRWPAMSESNVQSYKCPTLVDSRAWSSESIGGVGEATQIWACSHPSLDRAGSGLNRGFTHHEPGTVLYCSPPVKS